MTDSTDFSHLQTELDDTAATTAPPPDPSDDDSDDESEVSSDAGSDAKSRDRDDTHERIVLIARVKDYFNSRFHDRLSHLEPPGGVESLSNAELKRLVDQCDATINYQVGGSFIKSSFFGLMGITEGLLVTRTKIRASGLQQTLRANPEVEETLEALRLKYNMGSIVPPELKLTGLVFMTINELHRANSLAEMERDFNRHAAQTTIPDDFMRKYE